jgi:thioredoxin reductase (NADPH)
MKLYPVIIVGGGPAGMITAVQLKRYGIEAVLFERKRLGGLLWNANLVENYPGFPGGIPGPELAERIIEQYQSHGLEPIAESVSQVDFDGERFLVATDDEVSSAELVVIATGTNANQFPPTFANPKVSGHFYYEVADLADLHQSKIAIIGAGDAAFDYALNLSNRDNQVMILNRGEEIRSLPLLVARALNDPNIIYHPNTAVKAVQVQPDGLLIETVDGEEQKAYKVDVLLGAIGRCATRPDFTTRLKARETNLINERRLHLIGDVQNGIYRQTAIAVGDGLRKAMEIYQYLMETNQ